MSLFIFCRCSVAYLCSRQMIYNKWTINNEQTKKKIRGPFRSGAHPLNISCWSYGNFSSHQHIFSLVLLSISWFQKLIKTKTNSSTYNVKPILTRMLTIPPMFSSGMAYFLLNSSTRPVPWITLSSKFSSSTLTVARTRSLQPGYKHKEYEWLMKCWKCFCILKLSLP